MRRKLALFVALVMVLTSINLVPFTAFAANSSVNPGSGTLATAVSNASSGDTLTLTDGIYYVPSTISLAKTVTIAAASGTHPVIVGGAQVTGWSQYSGNIYRASYTGDVTALVENGQAGKIATSATYTATNASGSTIYGTVPSGLTANKAKVITYGASSSNWQSSTNVITSSSSGSLTFSGSAFRGISAGTKYEVINDKAVIDEAGEFAYDGSYIYYYPYNASNLETSVGVGQVETIFDVRTAGNLTLNGVDVAGASSSFGSNGQINENAAIMVAGTANIQNCRFYAIDDLAIKHTGSKALTVNQCTFTGIGGSALNLAGTAGATVTNCVIDNAGTYSYGAISVSGNNNTIGSNTIRNIPVRGINLDGSAGNGYGNVIEYNDVSACNTKVSDTGLVYLYRMDGCTESRRNTIRYNAFHDSVTYNSMGFGIYLDDDADYTDVYGNWVYNLSADTASGGYLMGPLMVKGTGSNIHDNVFANNAVTTNPSNQSNNATVVVQELDGQGTTSNNTIQNNIFYNNNEGNAWIWRVMDDSTPLATVDYNVYGANPGANSAGYFSASGAISSKQGWLNAGRDTNSLWNTNPQFTDAANGDFTVGNSAITSQYYNNNLTKAQIGANGAPSPDVTLAPVTQAPATEAPEGGAYKYVVDTTATAVMQPGDYVYGWSYSSPTTLTAQSGDINARVWVNGQAVGNAAQGDGVTISFDAILPASNPGRVYYTYSGSQGNDGQNVFFGFKYDSENAAYRLLKNLAHEDANDEYYNETYYDGTVPVMLYLQGDTFELYVDGDLIDTVDTNTELGTRWYYAFISYYAGNTATQIGIDNLKYLSGKAINAISTEPTAVPTAKPTTDPNAYSKIRDYDLSGYYLNGPNGTASYADGVLHMNKSAAGSNFNVIIWSDSDDGRTGNTTLAFDAKVEGGIAGNNWDGYAVSLRTDSGDTEMVRLVPTSTGVDITKGAGAATIASVQGTGYHAYSCQYNKANDTLTVYVDGNKVIDNVALGFNNGTQHGFFIKSGHNEATACDLCIADFDTYDGLYVRNEPGTYGEAATNEPVVTDEPVVTVAPAVTEEPGESGDATKIRDIDLSGYYWNGRNGAEPAVEDGVMTMVKDATGSNYNVILWSDAEDSRTDVTTLAFDAKVTGGIAGNNWDGYAVSLRTDSGDTELVRIVASATGVDITKGAGATTIASIYGKGYHAYSVVYDKANDTLDVYVDGNAVISNETLGFTGQTQHGFLVKSGHNDATNATLKMADVDTWDGEYIRTTAGTYGEATEAPTEVPEPGTALVLEPYANSNSTIEGNDVYTLDTNNGDASLYFWATNVVENLNAGKYVAVTITGEIPTTNADDCFHFGYMQKNNYGDHWVIEDLGKGDINKTIVLTPNASDYEVALSDIWNFCVYSTNAAGHDNTAELTITARVYDDASTLPTAAPTAQPTEAPATEEPYEGATKIRDVDISSPYLNGNNGATPVYEDGVLTMVKNATGSNYNIILWSDTEDARTDVTTLAFDAKVTGGIAGNNWDGYAVSLRTDSGDTELVRIVASATGVDITKGAGATTIASIYGKGYHAYSVVYDKANDTLDVYVDGNAVISNETLGFTGQTQHGFLVKSGHNDATNATLKLADVDTWDGEYIRTTAGTYGEATEAPTEVPEPGTALTLNAYTNAHSTWNNGEATLDTNEGDASLYFWADNIVENLEAGKYVAVTITGEIPTTNADDCFFFGYVPRDDHGTTYQIEALGQGDINKTIVLTPNAEDYETTFANIWNFCVYSKNAAGHDNTAELTITARVYDDASTLPTAAPTAQPTEAPATEEPYEGATKIRDVDISSPYLNGNNGATPVYEDGVLTMVKNATGSNYNIILWSDAEDSRTDVTTLAFDAKVTGGIAGNNWDGYAVSLRTDSGDTELVRLVPTATGVDITKGAGAATIGSVAGTGYHAYSVVYDKANDTLTVYVDGNAVINNVALGFTGKTQHGFLVKSGHNEATNCTLKLADVDTWEGEYIRATAGSYAEVTDAPTAVPTANPEGTALVLEPYANSNSSVEGNDVYTLDTNNGDASLYFWATNVVENLNAGKYVAVTITGEIPTTNADDCFHFGYMQKNNYGDHWVIEDLGKGDINKTIVLTPNASDYEVALSDIWNFCVYSTNAAGHDNTAELTITARVYDDASVLPTAAPTAQPTATPDPSAPTKIRDIDVTAPYFNGPNGSIEANDGVLHMKKDATGSNFNVVLWSDQEDAMDDTVTLVFDAMVKGGLGHSWDGYAISLWRTDYNDTELVRLVPTATGVAITKGAGAETIGTVEGTGYHAYSCVYNKSEDTLTVYVDGNVVINNVALGFTDKTQHGYMVKSGHNNATNCELYIGEVETWEGEYVRQAATLVAPTEAPTEAPTPMPTLDPNMKYTVDPQATVTNSSLYANSNSTVNGNSGSGDAANGDISIYNWSDGYRGVLANGGTVTVAYDLTLPSDNVGMVYFGTFYNSTQNNKEFHVGFAPNHDGTYTVVTDKGEAGSTANEVATTIANNSTGATVNGETAIPVYVVFNGSNYDVLINGRYSHSGTISDYNVSDMWCLAWFTYWAGGTDTLFDIDNFALYTDFALIEDTSTEAPTEEPATGATVTGTTDVDTTKYTVTATANGEPVAITIANGTYTIELPAVGNYTIAVSAPTAITYTFSVTEAQGAQIEGPAINLITGDFSGDGYITGADITALMSNIGAVNDGSAAFKQMDLSGDGYITGADITALMAKIGSSY